MPHIDVSQPHSLGADKAFDRVLQWLNGQGGSNPNVKPISTNIDHTHHSLDLVLDVYSRRISVSVRATDDLVQVTSSNLPPTDILGSAGMLFENVQLKKQLAEVLK